MPLAVLSKKFSSGIEMRVLANAGENIEHFASARRGVLHTVRSEKREAMMIRQIDQLLIDAIFTTDEMSLKFDVNIIATECVDQKLRTMFRILGSARVSRAGDDVSSSRILRSSFRRDAETSTRDE